MALKSIGLRDFVIVRELEIDLDAGFTVLTGETGAGKSILIDALQLALGARSDSLVVREGATRAEISLELDTPDEATQWLEDAGFTHPEIHSNLLIRRTVDASGKSRAWINGSPATATQLRELAEYLVDIHGQHAWAALTKTPEVRNLLDAYGKIDCGDLNKSWGIWRLAFKKLNDARAALNNFELERERLQWKINELDKLGPKTNEWIELNAEHTTLTNAQALLNAAFGATVALEGGNTQLTEDTSTGRSEGAVALISRATELLLEQAPFAPEFQELCQILTQNLAQIEDTVRSLHVYTRKTEPDPERLAQLDARMVIWMGLARRYKSAPADLADLLINWKNELAQLDLATDIATLEATLNSSHINLIQDAEKISKARAKIAPILSEVVTQTMQGLGMLGGKFEVKLTPLKEIMQHGRDDVEFLVAGHPGSTPRPVNKVASGGELSRIALAIAVTTSQLGKAQTLIFDEVDSGVGGAVAETVGRLMKQLGKDRQVMAVTHLPQVAACADQHLLVSKMLDKGQTISCVDPIKGESRTAEIARMLGGEKLSNTTMAHAKEMLGQ